MLSYTLPLQILFDSLRHILPVSFTQSYQCIRRLSCELEEDTGSYLVQVARCHAAHDFSGPCLHKFVGFPASRDTVVRAVALRHPPSGESTVLIDGQLTSPMILGKGPAFAE